ncbi:5-methyltetrahydropteroyltriglutamate--homocysteine S-methyltransferase [Rossellomorea marisflavi]|uniref:5-methyltetrahydropteroyltriglutamate-- homocysteine S-methyltransferase n=1 Tax=Rossellomorea marisflavi TaxID=189381 RepID=UPI0009A6864C|nr:5-methyltetrahydropteroyltriglutamate--homocysteine S-methyltransferase [Rossellomorea marisflavi]
MVKSSNLGYPRIGEKREWKKALEQFWEGKLKEEEFVEKTDEIRLRHLKKQSDAGIDLIPVGDFSLYDHVLDTAAMFGVVPKRFGHGGGKVSLQTYYGMARGTGDAVASTMTKWFNTNYHYIVPELEGATPSLADNRPLRYFKEAKEQLGIIGKPVLMGPVTFVKLSKGYAPEEFDSVVDWFVPLYASILKELEEAGAEWVQIDEPVLCTDLTEDEWTVLEQVYDTLIKAAPGIKVILQTYFDRVSRYERVVRLPVHGIGLDFVHDGGDNRQALNTHGFPEDKVLAAGIIDGRNIWRADLDRTLSSLKQLEGIVSKDRLIIQPSSSLLHVPVTVKVEEGLRKHLKSTLSFADEKLQEIVTVTEALREGSPSESDELEETRDGLDNIGQSRTLRESEQLVGNEVLQRAPFSERRVVQESELGLPLFPTTTIGSFPQTKEVRKERLKWRRGDVSDQDYRTFIQEEIEKWIDIQEKIGLDVLVHGEFERTDMVEYFGEKLGGFAFTKNGWVQSYGSRCVKPPIIHGDVSFQEPMTVDETVFAQSLTEKPVKGMLTGPITIVNWSFVRTDIPRYDVANQIALALRKEVEALEENGIRMIQVDEPALREGMPLQKEKRGGYLDAAVHAFKLATSSVKSSTQIHTHMCYSEFGEIIESIKALDADVISIETSRSHGNLIHSFEENTYSQGIGLGVYDIHSPRVPTLVEMTRNIERAIRVLDPQLFWINPDCGLKTRGPNETIEALVVMVEAAKKMRETVLAAQQ